MKRLILLAAVALSTPVLAQVESRPPARHDRVTEIEFKEGDLVEGDLSQPDVEYFQAHPRAKHSNLIRTRESFSGEVLDSVEEI